MTTKSMAVLTAALAALFLAGCGGPDGNGETTDAGATAEPAPVTPATKPVETETVAVLEPAPPPPPPVPARVFVLMETSEGEIVLELDGERAPISVRNFLGYVDSGFYEGTIFHRVIDNFMIQGGGFTPELQKKPTGPPIVNEWTNGLKNKRGTIAMARTRQPDSATAQFYINLVDNGSLDLDRPDSGGAGYAVLGKVVAGMDIVDAIGKVDAGLKRGHRYVPILDVVVHRVVRLTPQEATARLEGKA